MARQLPDWTVVDFIHRGPWWRNRGILWLNLCLILPLLTSSANGLDSSLINGLQILPDWQHFFNFPHGKTLGLINSAQSIGGLAGLPLTPFASDMLGRRAALFLGSIVMLAGVALQLAAWNVTVLICARIIIGFGLTFCLNAAPLLLIELAYPTQRGKITALYNTNWYLGSIISSFICFGASYTTITGNNWVWRAPTLVQGGIPFLQVMLVWFIPESPRFLMSKGRESQAEKILNKYHANNSDEPHPLVQFELAQIRHALRLQEEIERGTSYWSLFSTPGNRKRMRIIIAIALFSQWSGNGLVSYYINLVLDGVGIHGTKTKTSINAGLQVFNFIVAVSASFLVDFLGRRTLFLISNAGMLFAFALWTTTEAIFNSMHKTAAAKATIPVIFIFYFFYDLAYTPMLVAYTLEILPYKIRAKGFAFMVRVLLLSTFRSSTSEQNLVVFLTSAFNQFVNPWAIDAIGWMYYLVYLGWLVLELIFIYFFIVETKGRTLEETAIIFDGEQRQEDLAHMGGEAATTHLSRAIVLQERSSRSIKQEHDNMAGVEPLSSSEEGSSDLDKRRQSLALSMMTTDTTNSMNWLKRQEVSYEH
ncbi:Hexose transporterarabidopsis thliana mutm-like protein-1 [Mycena indigotica]|uniref:Hexose transporterarabidopsis thliana mutm-like protein-1 n=1 Tax=Mycena indigotica TaxID=2126181 RepID=A0A8H6WD94_9AGAR|nr:Hexose transporterarabidopsis thliana mutm-like protein-1 [Mycena indigotica]KAF7312256.1 Hexose transporterarabidopsis thliana mutm-like protein-1 [Mycena indigotica]